MVRRMWAIGSCAALLSSVAASLAQAPGRKPKEPPGKPGKPGDIEGDKLDETPAAENWVRQQIGKPGGWDPECPLGDLCRFHGGTGPYDPTPCWDCWDRTLRSLAEASQKDASASEGVRRALQDQLARFKQVRQKWERLSDGSRAQLTQSASRIWSTIDGSGDKLRETLSSLARENPTSSDARVAHCMLQELERRGGRTEGGDHVLWFCVFNCFVDDDWCKANTCHLFGIIDAADKNKGQSAVQHRVGPDGELSEAWYGEGQHKISVKVRKEKNDGGARGELLFTEGDQTILTVRADLFRTSGEKHIGRAKLAASGSGIDYTISLDATKIPLDASAPPKGKAPLEIKSANRVWNGYFDFRTGRADIKDALSLDNIIPQTAREKIAPLMPHLTSMVKHYDVLAGGIFTRGETGGVSESWLGDLWDAVKGPVCRAGCWGLGGAIAAAGCIATGVETVGAGCIAAGAGGAAGASLCSEGCPP